MIEHIFTFSGEGSDIVVGVEGGDIMGMSVGGLEVGGFHRGDSSDGSGFIEDGFVLLESLGFEEEKFLFDPAALGEAECVVIVVLHVVGTYHHCSACQFLAIQISRGV